MAMYESSIPRGLGAAVDEFNNSGYTTEGAAGLGTTETVEIEGIGFSFWNGSLSTRLNGSQTSLVELLRNTGGVNRVRRHGLHLCLDPLTSAISGKTSGFRSIIFSLVVSCAGSFTTRI